MKGQGELGKRVGLFCVPAFLGIKSAGSSYDVASQPVVDKHKRTNRNSLTTRVFLTVLREVCYTMSYNLDVVLIAKRSVSMKQKLFRGIVILLLIYPAVEIAFPQFCGESAVSILGSRSVVLAAEQLPSASTSASTAESVTRNSERTIPQLPPRDNDVPDDEDCFCCCAHVMPSPLFVNPETSALVVLSGSQPRVSIPTASLGAPYHPPRSA